MRKNAALFRTVFSRPPLSSGHSAGPGHDVFHPRMDSTYGPLCLEPQPCPKAMIVDNNPVICQAVAQMVTQMGFRVTTAYKPSQAVAHFRTTSCALVLTALNIPEVSGHCLGRSIKAERPETKVVIMTVLCQAEVALLADDGQIDAWLFKPFGFAELKATVANLGFSVTTGPGPASAARADHRPGNWKAA